jgi:hypothetical protein
MTGNHRLTALQAVLSSTGCTKLDNLPRKRSPGWTQNGFAHGEHTTDKGRAVIIKTDHHETLPAQDETNDHASTYLGSGVLAYAMEAFSELPMMKWPCISFYKARCILSFAT